MGVSFLRRSWKYNLGSLKIIPRTLWDYHNHPSTAIKSRDLYCGTLLVSSSLKLSGITETTTNYRSPRHCWRAETDEQATKVGSASFYLFVISWSGLIRITLSQKAEIIKLTTWHLSSLSLQMLHCSSATPRAPLCSYWARSEQPKLFAWTAEEERRTARAHGSRKRTGHGTRQGKNGKPGWSIFILLIKTVKVPFKNLPF